MAPPERREVEGTPWEVPPAELETGVEPPEVAVSLGEPAEIQEASEEMSSAHPEVATVSERREQ